MKITGLEKGRRQVLKIAQRENGKRRLKWNFFGLEDSLNSSLGPRRKSGGLKVSFSLPSFVPVPLLALPQFVLH